MARAPRYPSPREYRLLERMGREGFARSDTFVRIWLQDTSRAFDPYYGEHDDEFGVGGTDTDLAILDKRVIGENRSIFWGPYQLCAWLEFQEDNAISGVTSETSERGQQTRAGATVHIFRNELRKAKMIEAPPEEETPRMPTFGDIVEIHGVPEWRKTHDIYGVGPWYLMVQTAIFGHQIGGSPYWIELVLQTEMQTAFDPGRLVNLSSATKHPASILADKAKR
jgi:hypothetical protein